MFEPTHFMNVPEAMAEVEASVDRFAQRIAHRAKGGQTP